MHKTTVSSQDRSDLCRRFYDQITNALRHSSQLFYRYGSTTRTYRDAAHFIAKFMQKLAPYPRCAIAIFAEKSFEHYAGILGVLLSGNLWVPLSREMPVRRLAQMCNLAQVKILLVDNTAPADLLEHARLSGIIIQTLGEIQNLPDELSLDSFAPVQTNADDDAAIYFTSGSTGDPKGVRLTHHNFICVIWNVLDVIPFSQGEVFADYHDIAFVISVPIIFPCVLNEGAISPALNRADILLPHKHMAENGVTVLITVPSTLARLRHAKIALFQNTTLNVLLLCGEPLHLDILRYCFESVRAKHCYNFYGSTEVAPWTFFHECTPSDLDAFGDLGYMPIGKPLPGVSIKLDPDSNELAVSGANVTPGYVGGLYEDRFEDFQGARWYLTGDVVTRFGDVYICKGRLDSQVKIDGFRVDLMDVEANLRALPGVNAAVCFTSGEGTAKVIVAILQTEQSYDVVSTRRLLSARLPNYMMPRKVICVPDIPLNKNGKIDRRALKENYT